MDRFDFRSDTVSWPTPVMREAMALAPVGDDVYGEDPTVNALEALAAEKVGKEAALFVASGTMGNLVAAMSHASRGDEMIVGRDSHIMRWEAGSVAALGGIVPLTLNTDAFGRMSLEEIESSISPDDVHLPRTRLIHVENTYGEKFAYPIAPDYFAAVSELAQRQNLAVHLDGARLFNAAVALGIEARDITRHADSVTFCLSKGLCAPVGSVLCGSSEFIDKARRMRKALGGGMRQAGILAAAGIVALEQMIDRLAEDHRHAAQLAAGLATIPAVTLDPEMVRTNMVFFDLANEVTQSAEDVVRELRQAANIWLGSNGPRGFRAVTHYWINADDVALFLEAFGAIVAG
ncbi:MAG: low-specificity L-threonine aldolase [Candidatus Promineifilaceae bacterium]